jgi:hypothetical protein
MSTLPVKYNTQFNQAVADLTEYETNLLNEYGRYQQITDLSKLELTNPADVVIKVDVYEGPGGCGYVVRGAAIVSGVTYTRSTNVGPETDRTTDWAVVKPFGI